MRESVIQPEPVYPLSQVEMLSVTHTDVTEFSVPVGRSLYAFIYIADGSVEFRFADSDRVYSLSRGQTIYIPKGSRYAVTYQPPKTQVILLQFNIHSSCRQLPSGEPAILGSGARHAFEAVSHRNRLGCAAKIYELLALLEQGTPPLPQKHKRLLPAVDALQREPALNLPVSHYASLCHMSVPGFRRSFKEYTGQSPVEFRNELRLHNARKLIEQQQYSVEAAARISGFSNLSFFYRLFRRKFGTQPGKL